MAYGAFFFGLLALLALLGGGGWALARRRATSPLRRRATNAVVALAGLLASLAAAEGFFLFLVDGTDDALATLTSRRWVERHLASYRPDSFRGRLAASEEAATAPTLFIAAVGDSITFGQGIERDEDLYPSVLERELRAAGVRAEVFNMSRPGWNTPQELAELRRHVEAGERFDLIVLGFCLNDIADHVPETPGFREAARRLRRPPALLAPLVARSFAASFLYTRYVRLTSPVIRLRSAALAEGYRAPETFEPLARQLAEVARLAGSSGAPLIVVTFPDLVAPWDRYPYRDVHRRLDDLWKQLGATHVDLLPLFERHRHDALHAGLMDAHPNELAHRLAAGEVAAAVLALLGRSPDVPAGPR